jgi:C-terminal processing protease CtpA/Prc
VADDRAFCHLVLELVARLEDSHAVVLDGSATVTWPETARWDPGFACLVGDGDEAVVYHVVPGSSAATGGVRAGMVVTHFNGLPVQHRIRWTARQLSRYAGYSSERQLRHAAYRDFARVRREGASVRCRMRDVGGAEHVFDLAASSSPRYLPRLPVPIEGIRDSANVSWSMLEGGIGYIHVRRIRENLVPTLDEAVGALRAARGLVIDVRGNSGGGFDARVAHANFAPADEIAGDDSDRPRFDGPIAVLLDARCISAGEGWASWFVATERGRTFGEATAGASARKTTYTMTNGLYKVRFPVKAYKGFLDRPIERTGLVPDVRVMPRAADIAVGRDTVLEVACDWLDEVSTVP